jgi:cell wall-associated NlpC family hydrolase
MIWDEESTRALMLSIGKPWSDGAEGPDEFGCWGYLRWVKREVYGVDLPSIPVHSDKPLECVRLIHAGEHNREMWRPVTRPSDGDVVVMGSRGFGVHVGVFVAIDGGLVVHSQQGIGVVAQTPSQVAWPYKRYYRFRVPC